MAVNVVLEQLEGDGYAKFEVHILFSTSTWPEDITGVQISAYFAFDISMLKFSCANGFSEDSTQALANTMILIFS